MLTLYLLTNHGHVLFVLFIRLTQYHHFRSVYIYMLCSHLEVWGDGGGSEMKWLPSSRPLLESNLPLDISNEPVGLFTAMSVVTGPGFICCFFGGAFHGFIWQDILETDDRKWDKREGMTCSLDSLPTEVQVNPKPRYSSAKWGLSLTLTKCFLCITRSEPLVFQHESENKLSCRNVFQIWTIQMFIRSLQKRTTPTASLAIGFV